MDEPQMVLQNEVKTAVEVAIDKIKEQHRKVGSLKTPAKYVEKKGQFEYVAAPYVKSIADKYYPGWSWEIIKFEVVIVNERTEAVVIHGRLKWYEFGLWREGDMVAAHRIQYKNKVKLDKNGRGIKDVNGDWVKEKTDEIVDMGNDIKAGNTDCMKKAFNTFLNISDDIYRTHIDELSLNNTEAEVILELARKIGREGEFQDKINTEVINKENYNWAINRLETLIEEAENDN